MSKSIESLMAELKHANALLEQAQLRERAAAINAEAKEPKAEAKETKQGAEFVPLGRGGFYRNLGGASNPEPKPKDELGELISAIEAAVGSEMPAELRAELKEALEYRPKTSDPEAPARARCPHCGVSKEKYNEALGEVSSERDHWKDMVEGLVGSLEANGFTVTHVGSPLGMH